MGLTKQYLRYVPAGKFGIIASSGCNVAFVTLEGQEGRYVAVGSCEDITIWDLRLGQKALVLEGDKHVVTCLLLVSDKTALAAGYLDGSVKIFDLKTGENLTCFFGHRAPISCLACDENGHCVASGSKDTDIVVWDLVAESGRHRLKGHKGVITQIQFLPKSSILISSSKDALVKFWDLDTNHCFKTLAGHRSEVWSLVICKELFLVTGSGDNELRVWELNQVAASSSPKEHDNESSATEKYSEENYLLNCKKAGSLLRQGRGRVVSLVADSTGQVLACHGTDCTLELFRFVTEAEAEKRLKKRRRRANKKAAGDEPGVAGSTLEMSLADRVYRLATIKTEAKLKSVDVVLGRDGELRVAMILADNRILLHSINSIEGKNHESRCLRMLASQGHRSGVRALAFSSDSLAVVAGSAETVTLWNRSSLACLRTVATGYVLSLCVVPGDRHVIVGLKDGRLLIVDIASGDVLEEVVAHSGELWSVVLSPDECGCVSAGSDSTVKFWKFDLIDDKVLSLLHSRTLKLEEGVLAVKLSQNGRLVAAALLDSTVRVFFVDTLKFFLSLYGHKLPVLCMDMSSDSTIIATGSGDRNVKIWGLDFGDCHRSLFAHDDSVTGLQFVPGTHYFFTCGKDGKVKQWDADTYVKILTLQGHHGEAWAVTVSPDSRYVVSSGSDHVLRLFERSSEPLVLEDEAEEEREEEENTLATGEHTAVLGQQDLELPSRKTVDSEKAADMIAECLEVCEEYTAALIQHQKISKLSEKAQPAPQPPPLMTAYQVTVPEDFVVEVLKKIRSSNLEEALLLLPFAQVCKLLNLLPQCLARKHHVELLVHVAVFLLRVHHGPLTASTELLPIMDKLQTMASEAVSKLRDLVGCNLYGMQLLQRQLEMREGVQLFIDATTARKKRHHSRKRTLITISS